MYGEVQSGPSKVSDLSPIFSTSSCWDSTCSILPVPAVNAIRGSGTVRTLQIDSCYIQLKPNMTLLTVQAVVKADDEAIAVKEELGSG